MHCLYFLILVLLNVSDCFASSKTEEIKQQIKLEIEALQLDLKTTYSKINQLRVGKKDLEVSLKDMEAWGKEQQEEKLEYYRQTVELSSSLEGEKAEHKITKDKYCALKRLAGYICAALFMFAYFTVMAPGIAQLTPLLGYWGPLVRLGSPAFAALLGYYTAQLFL